MPTINGWLRVVALQPVAWLAVLARRVGDASAAALNSKEVRMQLDLSGTTCAGLRRLQGIGRASAIELAELGANVTLLARSGDALQTLADSLPHAHAGQQHAGAASTCWIPQPAGRSHRNRASQPVHILINNTGGPPGGPAHAAERSRSKTRFASTCCWAPDAAAGLLPGMRASGYGRIRQRDFHLGEGADRRTGCSNTVRAAVAGWAKTLAGELAADGITVNNVLPGYTRTNRLLDSLLASAHRRKPAGQRPQRRMKSRESQLMAH
jgi:3-oxoacyl-[acyl-carrier protein] reductase